MAREESNREDLLREATGLVERVELLVPEMNEAIVVGFRRDGGASFFFGADPVYQFTSRGELRRGYVGGRLLKAENGRLIALRRERTGTEVGLVRHELTPAEQETLLAEMQRQLFVLRAAIAGGLARRLRSEPPDCDVVSRIRRWLEELPEGIAIAQRPNVS